MWRTDQDMDAIDSVHLYGEPIQIEKGDLFTPQKAFLPYFPFLRLTL